MGIWLDTFEAEQGDLPSDRARIVRLCQHLTGDAHAAEDLAQETLLVAFQREQSLRDPTKRGQWLLGIARNLCQHWRRSKGLERTRFVEPRSFDDAPCPDDADILADDVDLEAELEKSELADLLDRAMALLPPDTREVLVARYVQESPHADLAARLGLREDAVKKRVERGRLALKRLLMTDLRDEVLAYGLIPLEADDWQQTRLWCPGCGRHRLEGRLRPDQGELYLRCSACSPQPYLYYWINSQMGTALKGIHTYKPAISRVLETIHDRYRVRSADGAARCPGCGRWTPTERRMPPGLLSEGQAHESIHLSCPRCGCHNVETWHSLTWSLPETRQFWKANPRMRFLPVREVEIDGSPSIVSGFESLTSGARIEVISRRDTFKVVSINGVARPTLDR